MIFFVLGLFLGSLLNNIALRLEKKEDFLTSRSKCPNCGKILTWSELIPILSFLLQKGRCKNCQASISLRYPLVELFTGFWVYLLGQSIFPLPQCLFDFCFIQFFEFIFYLTFLSLLFILALYDLNTLLVDDNLILVGIILGFLFMAFKNYFSISNRDFSYLFNYLFVQLGKLETIFSALLISSLFLIIFILTKGKGLGFGDVKVAFLIGLFLKPGDAILSVMFASFFGSIYALFLIFFKNRKFHQPIPFVPFFFLGVLTTISFGYKLTQIYFSLI